MELALVDVQRVQQRLSAHVEVRMSTIIVRLVPIQAMGISFLYATGPGLAVWLPLTVMSPSFSRGFRPMWRCA